MNYVNMTKLKFKGNIFKSSRKYILYECFKIQQNIFKISKNLSAKYYEQNK